MKFRDRNLTIRLVCFMLLITLGSTGHAQELLTLLLQTRHPRSVEQITVSHDGRYFATADAAGNLYLWDERSALQLHHLHLGEVGPVDMQFWPDSGTLLVGMDDRLIRVETEDGTVTSLPLDFPGALTGFRIDPGGRLLAAAFDIPSDKWSIREVRIWDLRTERWLARTRQKHDYVNAIRQLVFSPDGGTLYLSGDIADLLAWQWEKQKQPETLLPLELMSQEALALSPDGTWLAAVTGVLGAPAIGLWDTERNTLDRQFAFPERGALNQLAFDRQGRYLLAAFQQGTYDATGYFETGSTQGFLLGYDLQSGSEVFRHRQPGGFLDMAIHPKTGLLFTVDIDRKIQAFDPATGERIRDYGADQLALNGLIMDPKENLLWVGGDNGYLNAWNLREGMIRETRTTGLPGPVQAVGMHGASGRWAVASGKQIRVFDRFHELVDDFSVEEGQVHRLLFSRDGEELVVVSTNYFGVFSNSLQLIEGLNQSLALDDMTDLYTNPAAIVIRSLSDGRSRPWAEGVNYPGPGTEICRHPQHDHLFLSGDQGQYIFDLTDNGLAGPMLLHQGKVTAAAFSSQGTYLATGGEDDFVVLSRLMDGDALEIHGVKARVQDLVFSPDERLLAIADGQTVQLWYMDPLREGPGIELQGRVESVFFSADGRSLVAAGPEIGITVWDPQRIRKQATFVPVGVSDFLSYTPEGYYRAGRQGTRGAAFALNGRAYTFDQFDLVRNRPDLVLQSLGNENEALVNAYRRAYTLRSANYPKPAGFQLPEIVSVESSTNSLTQQTAVLITLSVRSAAAPLQTVQLTVNGVPLPPHPMAALDPEAVEIRVPLILGRNAVRIEVIDAAGHRSLGEQLEFYRQAEAPASKPDLYFLGLGSNDFPRGNRPLQYAEKDVQDLLESLKNSGQFRQVHHQLLLREDLRKEQLPVARQFLEQAGSEDRIIVFAAGHGLQGLDGAFFLATYDTDFQAPANRAITFSALDELLGYLPCRRKLLLLDACHTGEASRVGREAFGEVTFTTFSGNQRDQLLARTDFELMKDLFLDLRFHSGATVIASSSRGQASFESETYENGVFTYVLLQALEKAAGSTLSVDELKTFIARYVPELTDGAQQPAYRQENGLWNWKLW